MDFKHEIIIKNKEPSMAIEISPIDESGFKMESKDNTLYFSGSIALKNPEILLKPIIEEVNHKVIKSKIKAITVDLASLKFLNSTCIKLFAKWILSINNLPENDKYSIKIKYDSNNIWQNSIISTFVYLNPNFVTIERINIPEIPLL